MSNSPAVPRKRPLLVRVGLWGLKTRGSALGFMWFCLLAAAVSAVFKFWLGLLLLLSAWWYWYALRWADKNEGWK